jgi:hypothetical protein
MPTMVSLLAPATLLTYRFARTEDERPESNKSYDASSYRRFNHYQPLICPEQCLSPGQIRTQFLFQRYYLIKLHRSSNMIPQTSHPIQAYFPLTCRPTTLDPKPPISSIQSCRICSTPLASHPPATLEQIPILIRLPLNVLQPRPCPFAIRSPS